MRVPAVPASASASTPLADRLCRLSVLPRATRAVHTATAAATSCTRSRTSRCATAGGLNHKPRPCFFFASSQTTAWGAVARRETRRTFFGFLSRPPRQVKEAVVEPGLDTIVQWRTAVLDGARPPPRAALVHAFRSFFAFKLRHGLAVNSTHAAVFRLVAQYLAHNATGEKGPGLGIRELEMARHAILKRPDDSVEAHLALSKDIYHELRRLRSRGPGAGRGAEAPDPRSPIPQRQPAADPDSEDRELYILALTQYGASAEAAKCLAEHFQELEVAGKKAKASQDTVLVVLRGFAREGREEDLCNQLMAAREMGFNFGREAHEVMVLFYAKRGMESNDPNEAHALADRTRRWFSRPISGGETASAAAYRAVLELGLKVGNHAWLASTFEPLATSELIPADPALHDVLLQWAMRTGDFGRVKEMLARRSLILGGNSSAMPSWPTSSTTNALLEIAAESKDEDKIKEVLATFEAMDVLPNTKTYIILIDWLIAANAPQRALKTYREMRATQADTADDIPMMNRLIRTLCEASPPDFISILSLVEELEGRAVTLETETIIALCRIFLRYERCLDIIDILSVNLAHLSTDKQNKIQDTLLAYCLVPELSTARLWDCYQVMRQYFPQMDRSPRRQLMRIFFERRRPDMAVGVLKHMRQHARPESRPDVETYIEFFEGMGAWPNDEGLEDAYNMLKLDAKVQPSTRLYNALMIAYGNSSRSGQALDFWADLTRSAEGPSYESLEIIFAVCARRHDGVTVGRGIFKKLVAMDVDVTPEVYMRYVAAIGRGQDNFREVMELLERMKETVGEEPSMRTLGIVHNYIWAANQQEFLNWATVKFPEQSAELERVRKIPYKWGTWRFKLADRLRA